MDTNVVMLAIQDKLPKDMESQTIVRERLDKLDDKQRTELMQKLPSLNLKSPAFVFWVGSFLFGNLGVGRFMIGDTGLGIIRLVLLIVGVICQSIGLIGMLGAMVDEDREAALGGGVITTFGLIILLIVNIWWLVDLFVVGKKLRAQNMQKILSAIR